MPLGDSTYKRQTEPDPIRPRSDEWLEQPASDIGIDAWPRIIDDDIDLAVVQPAAADPELTLAGDRPGKIPMTLRLTAALKEVRHIRGPLVFCWEDGARWTFTTMRGGLKRQETRRGYG